MLSNLPICLAIDGYGPISDNAGGIAEMAELDKVVRERTDVLDSAGNTTAAIGKGFAIGSATLVGFSLYGAFLHSCYSFGSLKQGEMSFDDPMIFTSLLFGSMLPYAFSALTMKSVGEAALGMIEEVRRQIRTNPGILNGTALPDYAECIKISTQSSLKEMIMPGLLVLVYLIQGYCDSILARILLWPEGFTWFLARSYRQRCSNGHFSFKHRRCLGQC
jgi:inorganic pyrophosphatase